MSKGRCSNSCIPAAQAQPEIGMQLSTRTLFYLSALLLLNVLMLVASWGSTYLSAIVVITYLCYMPRKIFHPNNMLFAFFGLYVVMASTLNLLLDLINWQYVLPWGQQIFWDQISTTVLVQAEFTFLVLFFSFRRFCNSTVAPARRWTRGPVIIDAGVLWPLYFLALLLVLWFIKGTAGFDAWINDYSLTYLTKREGFGLLNVVIFAVGNVAVYLLALKIYQRKNKLLYGGAALVLILTLSFIGGIKGRFIFLMILLMSPYLMQLRLRPRLLFIFAGIFFILLYLGTLLRTEGFYSSGPYFLEMLVGYFNVYQLHDYVVTSRDPDLFQTVSLLFVKPLQILGFMDPEASFDVSVMLTKEFFPEQWELEHATQQWPLDTELYLNYYGPYLSWLPLMAYAWLLSWLYRSAILRQNWVLVPIFVMEFQRLFSTMRGTLIPWETPIYIAQYLLIYYLCRTAIRAHDRPLTTSRLEAGHG